MEACGMLWRDFKDFVRQIDRETTKRIDLKNSEGDDRSYEEGFTESVEWNLEDIWC